MGNSCLNIGYRDADHPPFRKLQDLDLCGRSFAAAFHIEGRGFRVLVEIETMAVLAGNARKAPHALKWARDNMALLRAEWLRFNRRA